MPETGYPNRRKFIIDNLTAPGLDPRNLRLLLAHRHRGIGVSCVKKMAGGR